MNYINKKTASFNVPLLMVVLLLISSGGYAQNKIPLIKASSKTVDVVDGQNYKKAWWVIMPERKPDMYYVSIPQKPHRVIFRTNLDSIAFDTEYGKTYDFIILLNGDSCYTRIIAKEKELLQYNSVAKKDLLSSDTIPISIGKNSKIYIKGRINNSDLLNFQFDLGTNSSIIKKGSIDKVKMNFDGKTFLINSDGRKEVPTSSKNTLKLNHLTWSKNITFVVGDNFNKDENGLLGNGLFLDKVIEINYDKRIMVIHPDLPKMPSGYVRQHFILEGTVPFIKASIHTGKETFTDWYMFDTGYSGELRLNKVLSDTYKLEDKVPSAFNPFKKTFRLPGFEIGNLQFKNLRATVHPQVHQYGGIIGNVLLKQYNVILDNKTGYIYLKPNGLIGTSGEQGKSPFLYLLLLLIGFVLFFFIKKVVFKS